MVQALYEEYGDRGFLPITLLFSPVENWVNELGLSEVGSNPVVNDNDMSVITNFISGNFGTPNLTLLAPGLEVVIRGEDGGRVDAALIEQYLPENY